MIRCRSRRTTDPPDGEFPGDGLVVLCWRNRSSVRYLQKSIAVQNLAHRKRQTHVTTEALIGESARSLECVLKVWKREKCCQDGSSIHVSGGAHDSPPAGWYLQVSVHEPSTEWGAQLGSQREYGRSIDEFAAWYLDPTPETRRLSCGHLEWPSSARHSFLPLTGKNGSKTSRPCPRYSAIDAPFSRAARENMFPIEPPPGQAIH